MYIVTDDQFLFCLYYSYQAKFIYTGYHSLEARVYIYIYREKPKI